MQRIGSNLAKLSLRDLQSLQRRLMPFYAVAAGWEVGIFESWDICETKVKGFSKAKYKKFKSLQEAQAFMQTNGVNLEPNSQQFNPKIAAVPLRPVVTSSANERQSWREQMQNVCAASTEKSDPGISVKSREKTHESWREKMQNIRAASGVKLENEVSVKSEEMKKKSLEEKIHNVSAVPLGSIPPSKVKLETGDTFKSDEKKNESWKEKMQSIISVSKVEPEINFVKKGKNDSYISKTANDWPDDKEWDPKDDEILMAAAEELERKTLNSRKRNITTVADVYGKRKFTKYTHESKVCNPVGVKKIRGFEFHTDTEGYVIVYTDGSCLKNGNKDAVAGFGVYFSEGHALNAASPVSGRVTNNSGEIQAAIFAIKVAKEIGIRKLSLSTDSQFLINSVKWMKGWKRKGWKLLSGDPVKNQADFKMLDQLLDGNILVKWNYVKAHEGIVGNEKADCLAREGAERYKLLKKT